MLHLTQLLTFEIGLRCNFEQNHRELCPITHMSRGDKALTDEMIIDTTKKAYFEMGFEGFISWHFYNEPMLYWPRMLDLMVRIRGLIPQSRFFLWTNGSILIKDERMQLFECSFISNYENKLLEAYFDYFSNPLIKVGGQALDNRFINHYGEPNFLSCGIMFDNLIIANDGEVYICCHDWRNEVKIGNLFDTSIEELDEKRWEYAKQICGKQMTDKAHSTCICCTSKWPVGSFDWDIRAKALQEIAKI